jgi:hypothetical protein
MVLTSNGEHCLVNSDHNFIVGGDMAKLLAREGGRVIYNMTQWNEYMAKKPCEFPGCAELEDFVTDNIMPGRCYTELHAYCFSCNFWADMRRRDNERDSFVVIEGRSSNTGKVQRWHYSYDANEPWVDTSHRRMLGHGGAVFNVEFFDGRKIRTNNMWCQGIIPLQFWNDFEPNGRLV